jgi:hypothetical protein
MAVLMVTFVPTEGQFVVLVAEHNAMPHVAGCGRSGLALIWFLVPKFGWWF